MPRPQRRTLDRGYTKDFSRIQRIRIEQSPDRPLRLRKRDVVRWQSLRFNPWWWISHRRGIKGMPDMGGNPLEARAIPRDMVRGTLPERIVYFWLASHYYTPGIDFDFQSSLEGGRLELGGIVVDFIFPILRIALQVQGPTHGMNERIRKDEEQRMALEEMGYSVVYLEMELIYDETRFEDAMRRLLTYGYLVGGGGQTFGLSDRHDEETSLVGFSDRLDSLIRGLGAA